MYLIFGKKDCSWCSSAKLLVESEGKQFNYVDVEEDMDSLRMLVGKGLRSLPQVFYNDKHIGGFTELQKHITQN